MDCGAAVRVKMLLQPTEMRTKANKNYVQNEISVF